MQVFHLPRALSFHLGRRPRVYLWIAGIVLAIAAFLFLLPPSGFPSGEIILIEEDRSFGETAQMLEDRGVVRSALLLKAVGRVFQADRSVQAGRYVFSEPVGLSMVLYRLANGISGLPTAKVTFPEGSTAREMGVALSAAVPGFDSARFVELAKPYEGTLFPDTYDVYLDAAPEEVVSLLRNTYTERIADVNLNGVSEEEAIIMASILEKEVKTLEDRRIVSGILWDRIEIGMALQVDAVFGYIYDRDTYHPSLEDLKSDSLYNTYTNRGLPPGAIGNPGIEAIEAAVNPTETEYLYYLTGTDGVTRYAETFEKHKENRERYLR